MEERRGPLLPVPAKGDVPVNVHARCRVKTTAKLCQATDWYSLAVNPSLFLTQDGNELRSDEHRYVWVPEWPGAPGPLFYRHPARPYGLQSLVEFLQDAETTMLDNYPGLVLGLGAMVSMLNFKGIHQEIGHFNLPVMYGPPMSGKTLAACWVGLVTGMSKNQISSRNTQAFLAEVFVMSSMPFLWDDPTKETEVRQVCIDLGNAAFRGKYKEDAKVPLTGCLVTANFCLAEIEKYYSRICLIPFKRLDKEKQCGEGPELERKASLASAALPELINISNEVSQASVHETVQRLRENGEAVDLRIVEGIAVPCLMASKILQACGLPEDKLLRFCKTIVSGHNRRQTAPETEGPPTTNKLEQAFLAAQNIDVSSCLKVTGNKVYIQAKELSELVNIDVKEKMKRQGISLYKSSSRFEIGGQKVVKKSALITNCTHRELSLVKEVQNQGDRAEVDQPTADKQPEPQTANDNQNLLENNQEPQTANDNQNLLENNQEPKTGNDNQNLLEDNQAPPNLTYQSKNQLSSNHNGRVYTVTSSGTSSVKFVGKRINHEWLVNGKKKNYKGVVPKAVKGRDGGKRTIYMVSYYNGDVEKNDLYSDYRDGSLRFDY